MRSEVIECMGSVIGGDYEEISIEGLGKIKGNVNANIVDIEGVFKSKGKITAKEVNISGIARIFRDIKAGEVNIEGIVKMRRARLHAEKIICEGIITGNREISADIINIDGIFSVSKMYGDKIKIMRNSEELKNKKIPAKLMFLVKIFLGKSISLTHNLADVIECTELEASGLKAKVVRANKAKLEKGCIIDKLYCDGETEIDDSCSIGKIIR